MAVLLVIRYIIEVDACHSDIDAIKGQIVEVGRIVDIIHDESLDVVVTTYTTIEEVETKGGGVNRTGEVDVIMIEDRLDVDIVSEEGKAPSEKRSDTSSYLWCYTKEKIGTIIDFVHLEAISQLHLCTPVVEVLDFDICGIAWGREYPIEKAISAFEDVVFLRRCCNGKSVLRGIDCKRINMC